MIVVQLLVLLLVANGAPVVARNVLGRWGAGPIDGRRRWFDGYRLLGPSKTWRGLITGVVATVLIGAVIGLDVFFSACFGLLALVGDLLSSFIKRRFHLNPSARATGLDQVPEALVPVAVCAEWLDYGVVVVLGTVALFVIINIGASPLLHRMGLRDKPY